MAVSREIIETLKTASIPGINQVVVDIMVAIAHWLNVWTSVSEVPSQILVPDRRTRLVYRCLPIKDLSRMPNFCHFVCQEKQAGTNHEATAVRHMIGARESRVCLLYTSPSPRD